MICSSLAIAADTEPQSTFGTDFIFGVINAFYANHTTYPIYVIVSNQNPTHATVTITSRYEPFRTIEVDVSAMSVSKVNLVIYFLHNH